MKEAIFGLVGVLVGSAIPWLQAYLTTRHSTKKNARFLAIRLVCILDQYLLQCVDVVKDDGLSYGQYNKDGEREPQADAPGPPIYPQDVEWRSIDHELMYKILSFPSEVEVGHRIIKASTEIAAPPDHEEYFIERRYRYSQYALMAYHLSEELAKKYNIKMKTYDDWDPVEDMKRELRLITEKRDKKLRQQRRFVKEVLG